MNKGRFQSKRQQGKDEKIEKGYIEDNKSTARGWWNIIKQLYYLQEVGGSLNEVSIEKSDKKQSIKVNIKQTNKVKKETRDNTENTRLELVAPDSIKKEVVTKQKKVAWKNRATLLMLFAVYVSGNLGLLWAVRTKSPEIAFGVAFVYFVILEIYKLARFIFRKGARDYKRKCDDKAKRIDTAVKKLADALDGKSEEQVKLTLFKFYEKRRITFFRLYPEQLLGIITTTLLFPSMTELLEDKSFNQIKDVLLIALNTKGWQYIYSQLSLVFPLSAYVLAYWLISLLLCITIQFPANLIVNEFSNYKNSDDLFEFYKHRR